MANRAEQIGIRVTPAERAELTRRAQQAGLSLTAYLTRSGLGTLDQAPETTCSRLDELESTQQQLAHRIAQLEQLAGMQ